VKFFFDNNLAPAYARALEALSTTDGRIDCVTHLRDRFAPNAPDCDWIAALTTEGGWCVITQDKMRKNDVEKGALRSRGLIVFVLAHSWAQQAFWPKATNLVRWWPAIVDQAESMKGGAAFRVPFKFTGKGRFEQIGYRA